MSLLRCLTWALAIAACRTEATAPSAPATVMLGRWHYASVRTSGDGPSLNSGLHVTLAVDSVDNEEFRGHVELWFSGDVGIPTDAFGPIVGSLVTRDRMVLTIPFAGAGAVALSITGVVDGDVITVSESWMGEQPGPLPVSAEFVRLDPQAE